MGSTNRSGDTMMWIDWSEAKAFRMTSAEDIDIAAAHAATARTQHAADDETGAVSRAVE
jgi:hypothetical protein